MMHRSEGEDALCERCGEREATITWIVADSDRSELAGSEEGAGRETSPPPPLASTLCDLCASELACDAVPGGPSVDAMFRQAAKWAAFAENLPPDMPLAEQIRRYRRAQRGDH